MAFLLILALIPIFGEGDSALTLWLGSGTEDQADRGNVELDMSGRDLAAPSITSAENLSLQLDDVIRDLGVGEVAPPEVAVTSDGALSLDAIDIGFAGRAGSTKAALLSAFGGTAETESAVDLGLKWLAGRQMSDGSWSLRGPFRDGGNQPNRASATAMALIAFAGAGHTQKDGEYKTQVDKGLRRLLTFQDADGFFSSGDSSSHGAAYGHAQATIALCELYGMTRDSQLRAPAQAAIDACQNWQDADMGGWRYTPREDSDTSVTGWFVMAMISGRISGLSVDESTLKRTSKFLDSVAHEGRSRYAYVPYSRDDDVMTAEGLLCRLYLGSSKTEPYMARGVASLQNNRVKTDISGRNYYYWYYASQLMHHIGGGPWENWNIAMRDALPAMQVARGADAGSWPPQGDPYASSGGRLYSTCFAIYCLEVYYRHMPLYEDTATSSVR